MLFHSLFLSCMMILLSSSLIYAQTNTTQPQTTYLYIGGDQGWNDGFEYPPYETTPGMQLVFEWNQSHNVVMLRDKQAYLNCDFTGSTVLATTAQGRGNTQWSNIYVYNVTRVPVFFSCSIPGHCVNGMKFAAIAPGTASEFFNVSSTPTTVPTIPTGLPTLPGGPTLPGTGNITVPPTPTPIGTTTTPPTATTTPTTSTSGTATATPTVSVATTIAPTMIMTTPTPTGTTTLFPTDPVIGSTSTPTSTPTPSNPTPTGTGTPTPSTSTPTAAPTNTNETRPNAAAQTYPHLISVWLFVFALLKQVA